MTNITQFQYPSPEKIYNDDLLPPPPPPPPPPTPPPTNGDESISNRQATPPTHPPIETDRNLTDSFWVGGFFGGIFSFIVLSIFNDIE